MRRKGTLRLRPKRSRLSERMISLGSTGLLIPLVSKWIHPASQLSSGVTKVSDHSTGLIISLASMWVYTASRLSAVAGRYYHPAGTTISLVSNDAITHFGSASKAMLSLGSDILHTRPFSSDRRYSWVLPNLSTTLFLGSPFSV